MSSTIGWCWSALAFLIVNSLGATSATQDTMVPPLIQGHAIPRVSMEDISHCPYVQPSVRAPNDVNSTKIYLSMTIDRLLEIDDLDQTISISATLYMQWGVYGCSANITASSIDEEERVLVSDISQVWSPIVIFANSSNDIYMEATQYKSDMEVLFQPTTENRTLYFHWIRVGLLTAKCNLNLRKFPFDSQKCDFTFIMKEPNTFLEFAKIDLTEPVMSPTGQWHLAGSNKAIKTTPSSTIRNGFSSCATFQISFDRNPFYHIYNLLGPCYVLIALVFASFVMPPEKPDRPVICCTILLAFVVSQSDVLTEVPHTSESILLAEYILLFTGLTALVTTHDMIMCEIGKDHQYENEVEVKLGLKTITLRAIRCFDCVAFLFALDFLLIINVYAACVIDGS